MTQYYREGARQGSAGFVTDAIVYFDPWGFSVADVTQDVGVWLAEHDTSRRVRATLRQRVGDATCGRPSGEYGRPRAASRAASAW